MWKKILFGLWIELINLINHFAEEKTLFSAGSPSLPKTTKIRWEWVMTHSHLSLPDKPTPVLQKESLPYTALVPLPTTTQLSTQHLCSQTYCQVYWSTQKYNFSVLVYLPQSSNAPPLNPCSVSAASLSKDKPPLHKYTNTKPVSLHKCTKPDSLHKYTKVRHIAQIRKNRARCTNTQKPRTLYKSKLDSFLHKCTQASIFAQVKTNQLHFNILHPTVDQSHMRINDIWCWQSHQFLVLCPHYLAFHCFHDPVCIFTVVVSF